MRSEAHVEGNRVGAGFDAVLLDLRYALRGLRKAPGFTAVILLTLALGIGANTAMFSIVRAMLIEPLPYRDAGRLVFIWLGRDVVGLRGPLAGPDLKDLKAGATTLEALGGIWASSAITLTGGDPEQLRAALVTTNFFDVLGVTPALGRTFRDEDDDPGVDQRIVLGWELFQRRFGADPAVVGRTIDVNETQAMVIGVMPKDFRLLLPGDSSVPDRLQAFAPFWPDMDSGPRGNQFLRVVARMRPGATLGDTRAEVSAVAERISREIGRDRVFTTVGLRDDGVRDIRRPLIALFVGVGILLTIACVNVAGLLMARAAARGEEIALRAALGAGPGRLTRLLLVEGLLLTVLGGMAGLAAGFGGLRLLLRLAPASLSRLESSTIDWSVLGFTAAVSAVVGVLFSIAPRAEFFRSAGGSLQPNRRTSSPSASRRVRAVLVTVQIALSVVLLVGASLLVRAFVAVLRVDPGFRTDQHLTFRMAIPGRYRSPQAFNAFTAELQRRLSAIPGVTDVGAMSHLPYDDMPNWALLYGSDAAFPPGTPQADSRAISVGLFETLGVPLVEGRFFTEADDNPEHVVAIVDDRIARELWPGRSALGQQFFTTVAGMSADIAGPNTRATVVGVVSHLRLRSLVEDLRPQLFFPWRIAQRNPIAYVIGASRDAAALAPDVRAAVSALDSRVAVYDVRPLQTYIEDARATRRFTMLLAALFALLALTLTTVGVYGVLAYTVAHRRHEIGVRRALGATEDDVMREVLREGLMFALVGSFTGLAIAAAAGRLLQSQLYGVHSSDPAAYGAAVSLVATAALVACWIPARRATAVDPMDALRSE
jgi:predicted permease